MKRTRTRKYASLACAFALGAALMMSAPVAPRAQRSRELPVNVTGISSRTSSGSSAYTISADGPLTRAQTWQDGNEFNIVLYRGQSQIRVPRGVQARRVGDSLMLTFPVRPGANVTVQPRFNRLELVVSGGTENTQSSGMSVPETNAPAAGNERIARERSARPPVDSTSRENVSRRRPANEIAANQNAPRSNAGREAELTLLNRTQNPIPAPTVLANNLTSGETTPLPSGAVAPPNITPPATTVATQNVSADDGWMSLFFSTTTLAILAAGALLVGLFLMRRRHRNAFDATFEEETSRSKLSNSSLVSKDKTESARSSGAKVNEDQMRRGNSSMTKKASVEAVAVTSGNQSAQRSDSRSLAAHAPAEVFGAFRIDQEVAKLVHGEAHRMDVLGSRAADDRRALEASLLKALNWPELDTQGVRRARTALEEYGFVAHLSASALLGRDTFERATAARALGEIKSPASLPFLLEALYDRDQSVRTEAVASLGAMQSPAAIGALLDIARRYPDMPASLLSNALSQCSVESLNFFDMETSVPHLAIAPGEEFTGEITRVDPVEEIEPLPEGTDDPELCETLAFFESAESADAEMRAVTTRRLAEYRSQASVEALTRLAASDPAIVVRSAAVTSLSEVDHESVFTPILLAFVDDAREVRAAAARSLSRLNFERADAYARVAATADEGTIVRVARACTEAGLTAQAIDRLASDDRRQAYESFALLSLIARAGEFEPLFVAVEKHADVNTRLALVRLLGAAEHPLLIEGLRRLSVREGLPEDVRTAVLEAVYKIDGLQIAGEIESA